MTKIEKFILVEKRYKSHVPSTANEFICFDRNSVCWDQAVQKIRKHPDLYELVPIDFEHPVELPELQPELPNKLHELLTLALKDFREQVAAGRNVDMTKWYRSVDGTCTVCLGGSVIANTLKMKPKNSFCAFNLSEANKNKLFAIDYLRAGNIAGACLQLSIPIPFGVVETVRVDEYEDNPVQFLNNMEKLKNLLVKLDI